MSKWINMKSHDLIGGTVMDTKPANSIQECRARCDVGGPYYPLCTGYVYIPGEPADTCKIVSGAVKPAWSQQCQQQWSRKLCTSEARPGAYEKREFKALRVPESGQKMTSVKNCFAACDASAKCTGIVYDGNNMCYLLPATKYQAKECPNVFAMADKTAARNALTSGTGCVSFAKSTNVIAAPTDEVVYMYPHKNLDKILIGPSVGGGGQRVKTAQECAQLCTPNDECRGYFFKNNVSEPGPNCFQRGKGTTVSKEYTSFCAKKGDCIGAMKAP